MIDFITGLLFMPTVLISYTAKVTIFVPSHARHTVKVC